LIPAKTYNGGKIKSIKKQMINLFQGSNERASIGPMTKYEFKERNEDYGGGVIELNN